MEALGRSRGPVRAGSKERGPTGVEGSRRVFGPLDQAMQSLASCRAP